MSGGIRLDPGQDVCGREVAQRRIHRLRERGCGHDRLQRIGRFPAGATQNVSSDSVRRGTVIDRVEARQQRRLQSSESSVGAGGGISRHIQQRR